MYVYYVWTFSIGYNMWCWRRLLRVPWTALRSHQSILKEINPEYSLEELMLKMKLQYFSYLMQKTDSLEKTLMLRKIEGRRRRGQQRMRLLHGITDSMDVGLSMFQGVGDRQEAWLAAVRLQRVGHDWATELIICIYIYIYSICMYCYILMWKC